MNIRGVSSPLLGLNSNLQADFQNQKRAEIKTHSTVEHTVPDRFTTSTNTPSPHFGTRYRKQGTEKLILPEGMALNKTVLPAGYEQILTPEALQFTKTLTEHFEATRRQLLQDRKTQKPGFLPETAGLRNDKSWKAAPLPAALQKRWVEIVLPADRKMMVYALNSEADGALVDLEDAYSPTPRNMIQAQRNLRDVGRHALRYQKGQGKQAVRYALDGDPKPLLMVRPRGWHMVERSVQMNGQPVSASLLDAGLYLFHNAKKIVDNGGTPCLYLPKMESYKEARLWNNVLNHCERQLGIPAGSIKTTVLIETFPAVFQMNEIIYELKNRIVGLNAGRWDYLFSAIKKRPNELIAPARQLTMNAPALKTYNDLLIQTAHARGIHAMGGMTVNLLGKGTADERAFAEKKLQEDKQREVRSGNDGTWAAQLQQIPVASRIFREGLQDKANQIAATDLSKAPLAHVSEAQIESALMGLPAPTADAPITEADLRGSVNVAIQDLAARQRGDKKAKGAIPVNNQMEDLATAEINRMLLRNWIRNQATLQDGRPVTKALVKAIIRDESAKVQQDVRFEHRDNAKFATQVLGKSVFHRREKPFLPDPPALPREKKASGFSLQLLGAGRE